MSLGKLFQRYGTVEEKALAWGHRYKIPIRPQFVYSKNFLN